MALLADRGQHRAPLVPGLIIAATAEFPGLTIVYLDKDFDIIAEITGEPMECLAQTCKGAFLSGPCDHAPAPPVTMRSVDVVPIPA